MIIWGPKDSPADLAVYAIDQTSSHSSSTTYAMTRVRAGDASYSIQVPPGEYYVAARLDSKPWSIGGYTAHTACLRSGSCGAETPNYEVSGVRVESKAVLTGIDVGDWGVAGSRHLISSVDLFGSPASLVPHYSPSPKVLASRSFPAPSNVPTRAFASQNIGLRASVPAGWREILLPQDVGYGYYDYGAYFSSEAIVSPLGIDSSGVWVTAYSWYGSGCPFPDWRYATARATVQMQGGSNYFFFEDPQPRDGAQPFTGYSVRGGDFVFGNCAEFIMMATTPQALEDNLPDFAAMVETAKFVIPCPGCPPITPSPS